MPKTKKSEFVTLPKLNCASDPEVFMAFQVDSLACSLLVSHEYIMVTSSLKFLWPFCGLQVCYCCLKFDS